jgi:hypothetical protein
VLLGEGGSSGGSEDSGQGGSSPSDSTPPSLCACIAAVDQPPCAVCHNRQASVQGRCQVASLACAESEDCVEAFRCLNACAFAPSCQEDCLTGAGEGREALEALLRCTCVACAEACEPPQAVEGAGGSGDAGSEACPG